jgi:uncharacterized membrane protein YebE (DUF533 family)
VIDAKRLLEQVLGPGQLGSAQNAAQGFIDRLDGTKGSQAFAGGAVAGGLLGLLLGGRTRRMRGGLLGYGGAAALGALALQAYQNYQRQQVYGAQRQTAGESLAGMDASALPHVRPAADGSPFELALVRAMVGAAKADGHVDAAEQRRLFAEIERLDLDAEAKAYVLDLLSRDVDLDGLTRAVATPEQGAELYLAARLAIDIDEPAERAFLDALATRLKLPAELRGTLDAAPRSQP